MNLPQNATNKLSYQSWKPQFYAFTMRVNEFKSTGSNIILQILQDQFNNLWIGTSHGLFKINQKFLSAGNDEKELLKTYDTFLPSDDEMTLIGGNIKDIYEDDQGLIWIGTSDGLSQFNSYSNQFKSFNFSDEYYKMPFSSCIAVDSDKNIWVGMLSLGVVKYKIENGALKKIDDPINELILGERVRVIYSPDPRSTRLPPGFNQKCMILLSKLFKLIVKVSSGLAQLWVCLELIAKPKNIPCMNLTKLILTLLATTQLVIL